MKEEQMFPKTAPEDVLRNARWVWSQIKEKMGMPTDVFLSGEILMWWWRAEENLVCSTIVFKNGLKTMLEEKRWSYVYRKTDIFAPILSDIFSSELNDFAERFRPFLNREING